MTYPTIRSPRWERVLRALVAGGSLTTADVLRISGSVNAQALIYGMRRSLGISMPVRLSSGVDRDGRSCSVAHFWLTERDRAVVARALGEHAE